jgi:hypothetical protein
MAPVQYAYGKLTAGDLVAFLSQFPSETRIDLHWQCSDWPSRVAASSVSVAPAFHPTPDGACGGPVAAILIGGEGDPVPLTGPPPAPSVRA